MSSCGEWSGKAENILPLSHLHTVLSQLSNRVQTSYLESYLLTQQVTAQNQENGMDELKVALCYTAGLD